jgi:ribulose bisphosphate carboxylase small subunit
MIEDWLSPNLEAVSTTKTLHKAAAQVKNCISKGAAITLEHVPCLSAERRQ